MKNQNKSFIWLIIFLVGFPQISETIYTPSLSYLASNLGVTDNQIQKTLSIYFAGFAIGVFLWGILSDIIGRKSSMIFGILLYILGSVLCFKSETYHFLLGARFLQAIGAAVGSNVSQTILRDIYTDKERVNIFSKITAILAFSPALGPLFGSIIVSIWNFNTVFLFLILIGLTALIWSLLSLKETLDLKNKPQIEIIKTLKFILNDRVFWIYGGLIGVVNGVIFSYYGIAPFIFVDHFKISIIKYGFIGFIIALACFLGARFCKLLNVNRTGNNILHIGNFSFFLGVLTLFISLIYPSLSYSLPLVLISIFIIFFGLSCILPICLSSALINHKAHLGLSGAVLGLYYYTVVGMITYLMSYFETSVIISFPLFLCSLFILNFVLIKLNKSVGN